MKRAAFVLYLVAIHGVVALMFWRWPSPPSHVERMRAIHAHVDATVPDGAVLFLGDSHTQRLAVAAVSDRAVNFGIGWQTAAQLADSMPTYSSLERAGAVSLLIGTNDLVRGEAKALPARWSTVIDAIPQGVPLYWTGLPSLHGEPPEELNREIQRLCSARPGCVYVAPPTAMAADQGHLSPEGYRDWIERLGEAIRQRP